VKIHPVGGEFRADGRTDMTKLIIALSNLAIAPKNISDKILEDIKTHFMFSITFFRKLCRLGDKVGKCCRAGQATDENMAHARCMLDT